MGTRSRATPGPPKSFRSRRPRALPDLLSTVCAQTASGTSVGVWFTTSPFSATRKRLLTVVFNRMLVPSQCRRLQDLRFRPRRAARRTVPVLVRVRRATRGIDACADCCPRPSTRASHCMCSANQKQLVLIHFTPGVNTALGVDNLI